MARDGIEQLVESARAGDDEAFYELISSGKQRLYAIAYAYLKNDADALEAIQEATCRAFMRLGKLKEARFFHTWFIRILIHYCIDEQKRRRKTLPLAALPEALAADLELSERMMLRLEVASLAPKYRHIILLKYEQDMTIGEIAELLGKPEGTIKTWLHKALKQLRKLYAGTEGEGEYVR